MKNNKKNGFTLLELLLYVTLVGLLLGAITTFFYTSTSARVRTQAISDVDQQATLALSTIAQAVRNADSITNPAIGSSGTQLTLASLTSSLNPTIFEVSGTTLQTREGASGAAISLTNSRIQVTNLTFKNVTRSSTPGAVQISLTVKRFNPSGRNELSYQKTFITTAAVRQ